MESGTKYPSSAYLALWMAGGAATGGGVTLTPAVYGARAEILESYIRHSKNPDAEAMERFLRETLDSVEGVLWATCLIAVIGSVVAIPVGWALYQPRAKKHRCREHCPVHGHRS